MTEWGKSSICTEHDSAHPTPRNSPAWRKGRVSRPGEWCKKAQAILQPCTFRTAGPASAAGLQEGTEGGDDRIPAAGAHVPHLGRGGLMGTPARGAQVMRWVSGNCQDTLGWPSGGGVWVSVSLDDLSRYQSCERDRCAHYIPQTRWRVAQGKGLIWLTRGGKNID